MAIIDQDIDFNTVQASTGIELLPVNEYILAIVQSDIKSSKNNAANRYVDLVFQVLEGPYKGRKLFVKYNIKNMNETAQNIGRSELKALREAIGMLHNDETQAWHNIRFRGQVSIKPSKDDLGNPRAENKINKYSSINSGAQNASIGSQAPSAPWGAPTPQGIQQAQQQPAQNVMPQYQQQIPPTPAYISNVPNIGHYEDKPIGQ